MKNSSGNQNTKFTGCLSQCSGCLLSLILFPFFIIPSMWIAFAVGPMGCALPNRCSALQENAKGILSIVILFGGGFGIPIGGGILLNKAIQNSKAKQ